MEALRLNTLVQKDGEIAITGLPYKKGEQVEIIVLARPVQRASRPPVTALHLRQSGLIGLWKDHPDITDSAAFARQLRAQAERR